jgi:hypothetical protein
MDEKLPVNEILSQLNKWKNSSARLFFQSFGGGITTWCVGNLQHVSSAELHFGMDRVDGRDLLFVVNIHDARLRWVDNRGVMQFFSVGRSRSEFGQVLEINLKPGGKAIFAEVFGKPVELPKD